MRASVLTVTNPFDPLGSRSRRLVRRRARLRAMAPRGPAPVIAILNGRPVLRAEWRRKLRDGDILVFCVLPRGNPGSNPLRMLLSIALLVFAPYAAGLLLGVPTAAVAGTFLGQATTLGIMLAGSAAINALLPVPQPGQLPSPSPTYTLNAQGNVARIDQAIPVQYGRLLVYPDFAAQPYVEYSGNEQYLFQLLCLGVGEFDIEDIRIEDTPISAFTEIETEIVAPGDQVTLFPTSVIASVEVSGQELRARKSGTWVWSGTTVTVTEPGHGRVAGQAVDIDFSVGLGPVGKYTIQSVPDTNTFTVTTATAGTSNGVGIVRSILGGIGGFVASAAGSVAHRLSVDLVLPIGLFSVTGSGDIGPNNVRVIVEARQVDDDGVAIGSWIQLGSEKITAQTPTPVRRSYFYTLATPGRYRIRAWRDNAAHHSTGAGEQVLLAGLRAYLREDEDFGGVTLIALRMRATNNLSRQASRKISVLATRKIPVWDGTSWSPPVATRSPAWALADAARNAESGAGLDDARIDLDALRALASIWVDRGDYFDGRFDRAGTWWEAASRIALAGRARIFMQGGNLRCVRDGADSLPVAMFSMRSIKRGSFSVDYLMPSDDTADAITVKYFDASTWATRRVTAALPGSAASTPAEIDLSFAITDRAQALREAFYHAAANRYRRRIARFAAEMEGFIPSIGDLIAISHDMPGWGAHAEATGWDAATLTLSLDQPMVFGAGAHYVGLRRTDGSLSGPWPVVAGESDHQVVLIEPPDMTPETGAERERTHAVFGAGESWSALAKVASVRPRGLYEVEIEAVLEDPSVHTAETGQIAPPIRVSQLPGVVTRPVVSELLAHVMPDDATRAVLSWRPAPDAEIYQIEMASGDDPTDPDVIWTRIAETTATHQVIRLFFADRTMLRVRALGLAAGPWASGVLGSLIPLFWTSDDVLFWTGDANLYWSS